MLKNLIKIYFLGETFENTIYYPVFHKKAVLQGSVFSDNFTDEQKVLRGCTMHSLHKFFDIAWNIKHWLLKQKFNNLQNPVIVTKVSDHKQYVFKWKKKSL